MLEFPKNSIQVCLCADRIMSEVKKKNRKQIDTDMLTDIQIVRPIIAIRTMQCKQKSRERVREKNKIKRNKIGVLQ